MKIGDNARISNVDVNDEHKWVPLDQVYPGYMASETLKEMLPHQRESFLVRCRDWYREAIHQIRKRIDISDPILSALQDVGHEKLLQGTASVNSAGILDKFLPRI